MSFEQVHQTGGRYKTCKTIISIVHHHDATLRITATLSFFELLVKGPRSFETNSLRNNLVGSLNGYSDQAEVGDRFCISSFIIVGFSIDTLNKILQDSTNS